MIFLSLGGDLVAREHRPDGISLTLLDGTKDGVDKWGQNLPVQVKELYSHWISDNTLEGRFIFVRPISFKEKGVFFCHSLFE